jgi:hypothetical protein
MFLLGMFLICACNSKKPLKNYYVVLERKEKDIFTGEYNKEVKIDTIQKESDSLAFWEGVYSFVANKQAEKIVKDAGMKSPPTLVVDYDVLNEVGNSIVPNISESQKKEAQTFIKQHSN